MVQENSIDTCILSRVKQITSPGWMHETSTRTWCTGKTERERVEREVGGGIGKGNTCKPMALSTSERDTCTPMFIAALFIIARTWKQPRCPSAYTF